MKKWIYFFVVVLSVVFISGCQKNDPPVIAQNAGFATEYPVKSEMPDFKLAVTVVDPQDSIIAVKDSDIDASAVNMNVVGDYDVVYTVTNSHGITATFTLKITVVDEEKPVLSGLEDEMQLEVGSPEPDWLEGVSISDNYDGTIDLSQITVDASAVDMLVIGEYPVTYTVHDASGNTTDVNVAVKVVDTTKPVISGLRKTYSFEQGTPEPDWLQGVSVSDNYDGSIALDKVTLNKGNFSTNMYGTFTLTCSVEDSSHNLREETITVTVIRMAARKELQARLSDYDLWLGSLSNYYSSLTENVTTVVDNVSTTVTGRTFTFVDNQEDLPFAESQIYWDHDFLGYSIIKSNGYQILEYVVNGQHVTTNYVCDLDDYQTDPTMADDFFNITGLIMSRVNDNQYKITGSFALLKNSVYADSVKELEELVSLSNLTFEINITFNPTEKFFALALDVKNILLDAETGMRMNLNIEYKIEHFNMSYDKFDLTNTFLHFYQPNSMETVYDYTDITQPITSYEIPDPHYYKVQFESGQYVFASTQIDNEFLTIYDANGNPVNLGSMWPDGNTFEIEFGDYFLCVKNAEVKNSYQMTFTKMDYDTTFDLEHPFSLETQASGTLEGPNDYDIYEVNADVTSIMVLECPAGLKFSELVGTYLYPQTTTGPDGKVYIRLNAGRHILAITADEPLTYQINASYLYDNETVPTDLSEMTELTPEFSTETYITGCDFLSDRMKLVVTEEGVYELNLRFISNVDRTPTVTLYSDTYESLSTSISNYLTPGTYYYDILLGFSGTLDFGVYNARYVFIANETNVLPLTLTNTLWSGFNEVPLLSGTLKTQKSVNYHEFTLAAEAFVAIYYNSSAPFYQNTPYRLYDEAGTVLDFKYNSNAVYHLPAGTYRMQVLFPEMSSLYGGDCTYYVRIAGITDLSETDHLSTDMTDLLLDQSVNDTNDYAYDLHAYRFVVETSGTYRITTNAGCTWFDAEHDYVGHVEGYEITPRSFMITFEAGTYYLALTGGAPGQIRNLTISRG